MPENGATQIIWSLDTDMREGAPVWMQPLNTYLGFFMDAMVGKDYEQGLQNLKDVAEGQTIDHCIQFRPGFSNVCGNFERTYSTPPRNSRTHAGKLAGLPHPLR